MLHADAITPESVAILFLNLNLKFGKSRQKKNSPHTEMAKFLLMSLEIGLLMMSGLSSINMLLLYAKGTPERSAFSSYTF